MPAQRQIDLIVAAVEDLGVVEQRSRQEGRALMAIVAPKLKR